MAREILDFDASYEWVGKFWFPDSSEASTQEFSGKLSYVPGRGISLTVIGGGECANNYEKKVMHAMVHGERGQAAISLLNVVLNVSLISRVITLTGSASALVEGVFLDSHVFPKMAFQYDDHFENIFLIPLKRERDALRYGRSLPIQLKDGLKISTDTQGWSTFMSEEDFETMFVSRNDADMNRLKEAVRPVLEDKTLNIYKRLETHFQIIFEHDNRTFFDFLGVESKWRMFWELLIDHPINIKRVFVLWQGESESGSPQRKLLPCLYSSKIKKGVLSKAQDTRRLPVNFHSFSDSAYNFVVLQRPIETWLNVSHNTDWEPVINSVGRFIESNDEFADATKYIALISDIETFLDLMGERKCTVDKLIELYGYQDWEDSLRKLGIVVSSGDSIGMFLCKIRRVMVHPKSCSKIEGGRYKAIVSDELLLHQIYSHLAALLMKAMLEHVGGLDKDKIEKFTNAIITNRCAYSTINFQD